MCQSADILLMRSNQQGGLVSPSAAMKVEERFT